MDNEKNWQAIVTEIKKDLEVAKYKFQTLRDDMIFRDVQWTQRLEDLEASCYRRNAKFLRHYSLCGDLYADEKRFEAVDIVKMKSDGWRFALVRDSDSNREIWVQDENVSISNDGGWISRQEFFNFCEEKKRRMNQARHGQDEWDEY